IPDESVTDTEIGGETLDSAVGLFGIEGLTASGLALIPLTGYAGYLIGERLIEFYGGSGEAEPTGEGAAVSRETWLRVDPISGHTGTLEEELATGGPHHPWEEGGRVVGPEGGYVKAEWQANGYFPGPAPPPGLPAGHPFFVLAFETEGSGYWAVSGPSSILSSSGAFGDYTREYESEGCTAGSWIDPPHIAGWPPHVAGNFVTSPETYEAHCVPWYETLEGTPPHYVRHNKPAKRWTGMQSYYWRSAPEINALIPTPSRECSGECQSYPIPSLPAVSTLGDQSATQFPGTTKENPHEKVEEWLETFPLLGEQPVLLPSVKKEVVAGIKAKNEPEKTEVETEPIAEGCLLLVDAAELDGATDCTLLPIFASGSDVATATEHDLKALGRYPRWVVLNYESSASKEAKESRNWYKGLEGCAGTRPEGESCDEYPFFATQQGGGKVSPPASLEWINKTDNSTQGGKYGNFVTGCSMASRSSTNYAFLGIPMAPALGFPTFYLCN
ncbi:MAG TPA: hypothetical protein VGN25_07735, partial [Solirubrobacteraceae bacterium]|nr:hypothetical protein [Solirubrobacteraceae bacterium]